MYTLGIDPGVQSGFTFVNSKLEIERIGMIPYKKVSIIKNKKSKKKSLIRTKELFNIFKSLYFIADTNLIANIEKPFLAQSGNDTMYINYGRIIAVLELLNIPYQEISSQQWLKYHNLKKLDKKDKPSTRYIPTLYPEQNFKRTERCKTIHDGFTDSVCIALYQQ